MAFLVPVIEILLRRQRGHHGTEALRKNQVGVIVITPTRELARQISQVLHLLLQAMIAPRDDQDTSVHTENTTSNTSDATAPAPSLVAQLLVGGTAMTEDVERIQRQGVDIIIGTPGRLEDVLAKMSTTLCLRELDMLVLDEADRLLDMGFEGALNRIIGYLPKQRRTGLFSATMTDGLCHLVKAGLRNPTKVVVKVESNDSKEQQRTPSRYVLWTKMTCW